MLDEEMLAEEICQPINNMKLHKPANNSADSTQLEQPFNSVALRIPTQT